LACNLLPKRYFGGWLQLSDGCAKPGTFQGIVIVARSIAPIVPTSLHQRRDVYSIDQKTPGPL